MGVITTASCIYNCCCAKRINYLPVPYYFYVTDRKNAIMSNNDERVFDIFKSFGKSKDILKKAGCYEKLKNIYYAHFVCNLVNHLRTIKPELRENFVSEIKKLEFDVDYQLYGQENLFSFEKDNMQLVKGIREHNYDSICTHMREIGLWR